MMRIDWESIPEMSLDEWKNKDKAYILDLIDFLQEIIEDDEWIDE